MNGFSETGRLLNMRLEDHDDAVLENGGKHYICFSNKGGRKGNLNSAEMAVIPIEKLK